VTEPTPPELRRGPPKLSDAVAPIAADAQPHEMTDPFDIGEALALLAENGDPLTVYPGTSRELVMARIRSVDPELPHFVLQLNEGEQLPAGEATFVASLRSSAKLQFTLTADWATVAGEPTLVPALFPDTCKVLNRRAAQRLEAPVGVNYVASFMLNGQDYELQLYDFSMGGVGMRAAPRDAGGLRVGRKLPQVRLELGPGSVLVVDLEVRLSRTFRSFMLGEQVQIGCQFVNLTPAQEKELERLLKLAAARGKPLRP
jgi:c-di-GMP-binding flagellar brake protein YcgR